MERRLQPRLTFLDTHIVVWLYAGEVERLSPAAAEAIEQGWLTVSPMVELELQFLHEIGRIGVDARTVLQGLSVLPVHVDDTPFAAVARAAQPLSWTRDPFDRLIVAQAQASGGWLVSKDERIRQHFPRTLWD